MQYQARQGSEANLPQYSKERGLASRRSYSGRLRVICMSESFACPVLIYAIHPIMHQVSRLAVIGVLDVQLEIFHVALRAKDLRDGLFDPGRHGEAFLLAALEHPLLHLQILLQRRRLRLGSDPIVELRYRRHILVETQLAPLVAALIACLFGRLQYRQLHSKKRRVGLVSDIVDELYQEERAVLAVQSPPKCPLSRRASSPLSSR